MRRVIDRTDRHGSAQTEHTDRTVAGHADGDDVGELLQGPILARSEPMSASTVLEYYDGGKRRLRSLVERSKLQLASDPAPLDADRAIRSLPPEPTVTILCLGNICRSPMAERYLRHRASENGGSLSVRSAGFIQIEDRPSPPLAVETAAEYGVDLSGHRSTVVSESMLHESDVVFIMDLYNRLRVRDEFGDLDHTYFLSAFGPDDGIEIRDPYGGDAAAFRRAYDEVTTAVDGFLAALENDAA